MTFYYLGNEPSPYNFLLADKDAKYIIWFPKCYYFQGLNLKLTIAGFYAEG